MCINIILRRIAVVFTLFLLVSCEDDSKQSGKIPTLVNKSVLLASGVSSKTDQFVVINSLDGKEVAPCDKVAASDIPSAADQSAQKNGSLTVGKICDLKIIHVDEVILNALKIRGPVDGVISKDGVETKAKFSVSIQATFEDGFASAEEKGAFAKKAKKSSNNKLICHSEFSNGNQYIVCVPASDSSPF